MHPAPHPPNEARRLSVLRELGLLDTDPEAAFDALALAAAKLTDCPIGLITLVDEHRQWFKAAHGLALRETPRDVSLCAHTILGDALLEVPDTHTDLRFHDNPMVTGSPHLRFYAGVPLQFRGATLGTLCVVDTAARRLQADERDALLGLARTATELLRSRQRMNALNAEHRRLLDFGRASGDWMWETDGALRTTWVSSAFGVATGLAPESVIGEPLADQPLLDAHGAARSNGSTLGELMRRRQPFSRAVTAKQTPRGLLYVSRSAVPVFEEGGAFAGYRGTARDVSAQVAAMRRSRGQDALLRKLSSQVPGVIFQFQLNRDGSFHYPYASDGLREMFGIETPFDAAGADASLPLRMLHPEDRPGFADSIRKSADALTAWQREYRIVRGDGAVRWLETRAMPERLGDGGTLWHGFTADVTERKETELALRRSEERWEMAADAAGIGIAELDLASGGMALDRRACINHGVGYPLAHYTLAAWMESIHPDDRDAMRVGIEQALQTRGTHETRYRLVRPDGRQTTLEATARGRYDAQGQPIGVVGTCRDVTAQLEIERLQRDKEAAERANRAKSEFLSRVSHELRTPLNGILGFAQLMSLDRVAALAPEQQRRLDSVVRAGRHLLALINDVLDVTRIESDDFSLQPACVDAGAALDDCLALIQPLAQEAGVTLPPPPRAACWVQADPRALEQVLMNLLSNAIKYNRPRGAVAVDVGPAAGESGASRTRIAIRDEGAGMSDAQQASLFQPFNRLGAEHSRTEGSGLGLVICQRLVDAMGGRLEVRSQPGAGSTFTVELPAGAAQPALPAAVVLADAAPVQRATGPREVLYIEDEPLNMVLMKEVFRTQPHWTLRVAEDGAAGARIARQSRPDLVLIDMNLPDTNGLALIRELRGDPRTRQLRCIALSADAMREQIDAALAAGFDDYWTKPIDVQRVLSDLSRLLAGPSATPA
ncbi:ATP-binding protein [Piscinibacter sp. XHJ-5]|uniref:ATP-binding protein n=1 Tax=Piscinibacter sp. XHJ-5 TaxID=3037797 RepID=UPI0024535B35|nr:ATP-binding protein [Piscinibacter sp. XHJ-5]